MAAKIKMWQELGPKLASATPMESEEIIEELIAATNQTRGSILQCSQNWMWSLARV